MWKHAQKRPTVSRTIFHLQSCEFIRTPEYSKFSGFYHKSGDYQVACTPKTVNLSIRSHWRVLFAVGAIFFRNFISSFNDQRDAMELPTVERQFKAHTSRVQDDPIFGPVLHFVVQTCSPCTSVLFPVSLYVVLASCNLWDYLVGRETRLVVGCCHERPTWWI